MKAAKKLLRDIEKRAVAVVRENDGVLVLGDNGRLLVELQDLDEPDDAIWTIKRLLDALNQPFQVGSQNISISGQIGVAFFPEDGRDGSTLVRNSGIALRRTQEENPLDGYTFYSAEMTESSRVRFNIEAGIREALQKNEFDLSFQPIVDAKTGALSAAEALLRCRNHRLIGIGMDQIIDVAEKSSLIAEIDKRVLEHALMQMAKWCAAGPQLPKISINISARQLSNTKFMDFVFESIRSVPFSPSRVQIEVTETAKLADVQIAAPHLKRLQQLGVSIALDDFGTGQASLTYLQRLHPDVIKIDRSFVNGVNTNHANATLVSAMTVMAHCLGLSVVVEGVEDDEQLKFLRETRCNEIQGYIISKPMSAQAMSNWMALYVRANGTKPYSEEGKPQENPQQQVEPQAA